MDAVHLMLAGKDKQDDLGRWKEIKRRRPAVSHEARNPSMRAARTRREGDLAGKHFVVVLLHVLLHPWLQIRIAQIRDPVGRLSAGAVADERMRRIVGDR